MDWNIIGHDKQLKQLEKDVSSGNLAHAYLFVGENHLGKFSVARKMAEILQQGGVKGLDTVEICGREESIKIEAMKKMSDRNSLSSQSPFKIILIQNAERMTIPAANSFLKTLEEPAGKTIFILTAPGVSSLLPTVVSRTRVVKFGPVEDGVLNEFLREKGVVGEDAKVMLELSTGRPGRLVSFMEGGEIWQEQLRIFEEARGLMGGKNIYEKFAYVEKFLADKRSETLLLEILTTLFRKQLREGERAQAIKSLSKIREAGILLGQNVNGRLVLENLMLQFR